MVWWVFWSKAVNSSRPRLVACDLATAERASECRVFAAKDVPHYFGLHPTQHVESVIFAHICSHHISHRCRARTFQKVIACASGDSSQVWSSSILWRHCYPVTRYVGEGQKDLKAKRSANSEAILGKRASWLLQPFFVRHIAGQSLLFSKNVLF